MADGAHQGTILHHTTIARQRPDGAVKQIRVRWYRDADDGSTRAHAISQDDTRQAFLFEARDSWGRVDQAKADRLCFEYLAGLWAAGLIEGPARWCSKCTVHDDGSTRAGNNHDEPATLVCDGRRPDGSACGAPLCCSCARPVLGRAGVTCAACESIAGEVA